MIYTVRSPFSPAIAGFYSPPSILSHPSLRNGGPSMVAQHGIHLAVGIVSSQFGSLVAKVCGILLRRGSLSLQDLVRFTELSSSRVKNCLLILIQHNCVQAFSMPRHGGPGGVTKVVTFYMALFDNILHRTRFTKFLAAVRSDRDLVEGAEPSKLKTQCVSLLEGLLQHGRLTFEQLVVRGTSKQGSGVTQDDLRADFNRLVYAHYIERCPRPEPFVLPPSDDKPTRKRGSKSVDETPSLEQQALEAATLSDAERFSAIVDVREDSIDTKVIDLNASVGDKRKYEALEMDQEVQATITEKEVLWRANFEKFVHCLKRKVCVANVRTRLGIDAGIVLEAMIDTSRGEKIKDKNSVVSSMDNILSRARKNKGHESMTLDHLRIILEQLGCHLCTEEEGALYSIDLKYIIGICQNDEVESLVLKRHGKDAYRIFRLLLAKNGQLEETKKIADTTFVEQKETKNILYKLWKDDYLIMERAASHASAQAQYFLWRVNKNSLQEHILTEMYHAMSNITQRIAHVVERQTEVLLTRENLEQLRKSRWILESSLLKLDDCLMLFHDF